MRINPFTVWEVATHAPTSARPGLIPARYAWPLTAAASVLIGVILWPALGYLSLPIAALFGRLLALDATTYTLPNVYTIPMLCVGLLHAQAFGRLQEAILATAIILLLGITLLRLGSRVGLGGGDLKLLAALFALMPTESAFAAIAVGCLLYMPVAFAKPKATVPFGVPLIMGWVILLRVPHLPNWLISTIS